MTLTEVLFALLILLVGLMSIAAIFPVAAKIQSEAFDEVLSDHVARNAEAVVRARRLSLGTMNGDFGLRTEQWDEGFPYGSGKPYKYVDIGGTVCEPGGDILWWNPDNTGASDAIRAEDRLHLADRSYPSTVADPARREFYWVPLLRDSNLAVGMHDMATYICVLKRQGDARYDAGTGDGGGEGMVANMHDPVTVPKMAHGRQGTSFNPSIDRYPAGTPIIYQQFPTTTVMGTGSNIFSDGLSGDPQDVPEARRAGDAYNGAGDAGNPMVWEAPPHWDRRHANDQLRLGESSRRSSPLKRVRMFGGQTLRR